MVLQLLDALLLPALAIPVVMQYRIRPMEGTPYGLFGIFFLVLLSNAVISFAPEILGKGKKYLTHIKTALMVAAIVISLGGSVWTAMADRAKTAPVWGVHDIILQQEAAMRYLLQGKNPYRETYFGTFVEEFDYGEIDNPDAVNPALYHFVMPPWYLIFPLPFYWVSVRTLGYFDARLPLLFLMGVLLVALWYWFKDKAVARLAVILTALSPSVVGYFVEGRSDVFALSWLVVSLVFLQGKRYVWSGASMALAVLSKQTIWFMLPFYLSVLWKATAHKRGTFWAAIGSASVVASVLTVPFLAWDTRAFLDSVVFYLSGNTPNSYPVAGYGLGMVLYNAGIIRNLHAYYPFIIWQAVFCIPLFIFLIRWLQKNPAQSNLVAAYAVFLSVFWYLSRYFNNSHLGYLTMIVVLGGLKHIDDQQREM